jgi:hypothetical protein
MIYAPKAEGAAPTGLEDSTQGFNPGTRPSATRLKGRQIERASNVEVGSIAHSVL